MNTIPIYIHIWLLCVSLTLCVTWSFFVKYSMIILYCTVYSTVTSCVLCLLGFITALFNLLRGVANFSKIWYACRQHEFNTQTNDWINLRSTYLYLFYLCISLNIMFSKIWCGNDNNNKGNTYEKNAIHNLGLGFCIFSISLQNKLVT